MNAFQNSPLKYAVPGILFIGLLWLSYEVLREFLLIITWAFIIAYVMWIPYQRLKSLLDNRATLSAAVMTGIITLIIFLAAYWLLNTLQREIASIYQILLTNFSQPPKKIPESLNQVPWLVDYLQPFLDQLNADEVGVKTQIINWAKQWVGEFGRFLGGVGRNIMTFGFTLVTLFFCFRDGHKVVDQLRQGLSVFLGQYQNSYLQAAGDTTRAVVYGVVLAALSQGLIAGLGYSFVDLNAPAFLGAVTAILALIPMGAMLVWLPAGIGLILSGQHWQGLGLLLWGVLAISTIDNVVRPIVISGAGRIPFLIVLFGVFGGLTAFGLVGLFLGPIILSVLLAVWQAWLKQQHKPDEYNKL